MKYSGELQLIVTINFCYSGSNVHIKERLGVQVLASVIMNFESGFVDEYD